MKFKILFVHHDKGQFVEDFLVLIRLLLESVGQEVDYDHQVNYPGYCHIIVDDFDPEVPDVMRKVRERGSEWIVVATEFITGNTFNRWHDPSDTTHYSDPGYWQARFDLFVQTAAQARAVWVAMDYPDQLAAYRAVVPAHVPVLPLPFPFCPHFQRNRVRFQKDLDIYFSGTMTNYRTQLVTDLMNRHTVFRTDYLPEYLRREFVSRSKITLSLRQGADWPFPSQMRYWYHLNQGCCVVADACSRPCRLDKYVLSVPGQDLGVCVAEVLKNNQWQTLAAEMFNRFAAEFPCQPAAEELLRRTFNV
jgi:hypothetical protein